MLSKAIELAVRAHDGFNDKCGQPYILHPLRVMLSLNDELSRICAVLHDVVEDTEFTFDDLREEGFSEEVIEIVDCLTKKSGEKYEDYINRILANEVAMHIKLADLNDNMDPNRISCYDREYEARFEKYKIAKRKILDHLFV